MKLLRKSLAQPINCIFSILTFPLLVNCQGYYGGVSPYYSGYGAMGSSNYHYTGGGYPYYYGSYPSYYTQYQPYYAGYGNAEMPGPAPASGPSAPSTGNLLEGQTCSYSEACAEDTVCYSGTCSTAVPTKQQCQSDSQCPSGGCKFNYCWTVGEAGVQPPEGGGGGETLTCGTQEDCPADKICSDIHKYYCIDGFNLGYPCSDENDCDKNDVCKAGTCWREGEDPGNPLESDCKKDDECVAMAVCENESCKSAIVTTDKCFLEIECSGRQACRFGYCWSVTEEVAGENTMNPCKTHDDCAADAICSEMYANRCMKGHTIGTPCTSKDECGKDLICKSQQCWKEGVDRGFPVGTACSGDEQCVSMAVCESKICKAAERQTKTCTLEFSCGKDSGCRYGFCWLVKPGQIFDTEKPGGPCTKQTDCASDEICSEAEKNKCAKGHSIGLPCKTEKDCSKKHVCKNDECWIDGVDRGAPAMSACTKDDQCAARMICERERCKPAKLEGKSCLFESSCGKNSACRYGQCWVVAK